MDAEGVLKEQYVTVGVKSEGGGEDLLRLRRITYMTEESRVYVFITSDFRLPDEEIAIIYRNRWMIELAVFKQIKQNFPLKYFWGESPKAIKTQIYCVLMAQLLMVVIRKKSETRKSFANMITVIRLHLMSYVSLLEFVKDTYKAWRKAFDMQVALSP
jgi:IS4 transposase